MENEYYQALLLLFNKYIPEIKHIRLYNNQFEKMNEENSFNFPCVFIQMTPEEIFQYLNGVQTISYIITFHLGFESYKDEDVAILELKQRMYTILNRFQYGFFTKLIRINERPNFDYDNLRIYELDFKTVLTDYTNSTKYKQVSITPTIIPVIKNN